MAVEPLAQPLGDVVRAAAKLVQVLPHAEAAAGARQHDDADAGIRRPLERRAQPVVRRRVERVEDVRPVERDRQDGAVAAYLDLAHRSRNF